MGYVAALWLVVLGVLGAANLIIARRPDAKEALGKIQPYQGWIGAIAALWGVWDVIHALINIGVLGLFPIWWITYLAVGAVQILLGFLLGLGVMRSFVTNPAAVEKMQNTAKKLAPMQGLLGLVAIGLGVWFIVANIAFFV